MSASRSWRRAVSRYSLISTPWMATIAAARSRTSSVRALLGGVVGHVDAAAVVLGHQLEEQGVGFGAAGVA